MTILHITEFVLYDLNRTVNEEIGREIVDIKDMGRDEDNEVVINYRNVSKYIFIQFTSNNKAKFHKIKKTYILFVESCLPFVREQLSMIFLHSEFT